MELGRRSEGVRGTPKVSVGPARIGGHVPYQLVNQQPRIVDRHKEGISESVAARSKNCAATAAVLSSAIPALDRHSSIDNSGFKEAGRLCR